METFNCSGEHLPNSTCQFLEAEASFPPNFASILSAIKHNSSVLFLTQALYTLVKSSQLKTNFWDFRVPESKFVKFLVSVLKRQVNSFSDFSLFFSVITYNSYESLWFRNFVFWTKGSHKNTNFDIFQCSDENLPNSSCHFPNHKSFFLQILHDSSIS